MKDRFLIMSKVIRITAPKSWGDAECENVMDDLEDSIDIIESALSNKIKDEISGELQIKIED